MKKKTTIKVGADPHTEKPPRTKTAGKNFISRIFPHKSRISLIFNFIFTTFFCRLRTQVGRYISAYKNLNSNHGIIWLCEKIKKFFRYDDDNDVDDFPT